MTTVAVEVLRELELEGYAAVMRAFYAGTYDWEKEEILTKLRSILNIDNNQHADVLTQVKGEMQAIRSEGQLPSSTKPRAGPVSAAAAAARNQARGSPAGTPAARSGGIRPSAKPKSASRTPGSRVTSTADPYDYVGRRVWRFWPTEDPAWVEGYVYEYDAESGTHSILYDPNHAERETLEDGYSFALAGPNDFVLGEFVDLRSMNGSRRVRDRPVEAPVLPQAPPAPAAAGAATPADRAPSKKRRGAGSTPLVPAHVPFEPAWLNGRLQVAPEEELQELYSTLERRETELVSELGPLNAGEVLDEDAGLRAQLEAEFQALCERETGLMAELATLSAVEE